MRNDSVVRLLVAVVLGLVAGAVVAAYVEVALGILSGFAVTNAAFVVSGWTVLWGMTPDETEARAVGEDFRPWFGEVVVLVVAVGALAAIGLVLVLRGSDEGALGAAVALLGVFMAWASLHLMYAARYAHVYYRSGTPAGIDFNQDGIEPTYRDFLYFSYNLGMTYQVSDTNVTSSEVRSIVLRHCLLSYVFGAVVLASTINQVAGIATR